jgi:hypothetical protein
MLSCGPRGVRSKDSDFLRALLELANHVCFARADRESKQRTEPAMLNSIKKGVHEQVPERDDLPEAACPWKEWPQRRLRSRPTRSSGAWQKFRAPWIEPALRCFVSWTVML